MPVFGRVKDALFSRGTCVWTYMGVELARAGLLAEIRCIAVQR